MDVVSVEIGNDLSYNNKKSFEEKPGFRTSTLWNAILSILVVALILTLIVECKDYVKYVLLWVNNQDPRAVFLLFVGLFTLVSFPFLWGYMLLTVACGYFFGIVNGFLTVVFSANLGVGIAHFTIRAFNMRFPVIKLVNFETLHAILRVISGPQAFKVVALARISPIPFGIQNTIFALSGINNVTYFIATILGLLPAQLINLYLGSTLRSIGDVISDHHSTPITGYLMFCCQILVGISLMTYVVQKARVELREALSNPVSSSLHGQPGAKQIPDFIV